MADRSLHRVSVFGVVCLQFGMIEQAALGLRSEMPRQKDGIESNKSKFKCCLES